MMIANSFDEFVGKVLDAECKVLNTELGKEFTRKLLELKLKENPNMTEAEWKQTKSDFLTVVFMMFITEHKEAMQELAVHTYNEFNKED